MIRRSIGFLPGAHRLNLSQDVSLAEMETQNEEVKGYSERAVITVNSSVAPHTQILGEDGHFCYAPILESDRETIRRNIERAEIVLVEGSAAVSSLWAADQDGISIHTIRSAGEKLVFLDEGGQRVDIVVIGERFGFSRDELLFLMVGRRLLEAESLDWNDAPYLVLKISSLIMLGSQKYDMQISQEEYLRLVMQFAQAFVGMTAREKEQLIRAANELIHLEVFYRDREIYLPQILTARSTTKEGGVLVVVGSAHVANLSKMIIVAESQGLDAIGEFEDFDEGVLGWVERTISAGKKMFLTPELRKIITFVFLHTDEIVELAQQVVRDGT